MDKGAGSLHVKSDPSNPGTKQLGSPAHWRHLGRRLPRTSSRDRRASRAAAGRRQSARSRAPPLAQAPAPERSTARPHDLGWGHALRRLRSSSWDKPSQGPVMTWYQLRTLVIHAHRLILRSRFTAEDKGKRTCSRRAARIDATRMWEESRTRTGPRCRCANVDCRLMREGATSCSCAI